MTAPGDPPAPAHILDQFLRGLRFAVLSIAAVVLVTASLPRNAALYRPLWLQLAAFGVFASIVVTEAVLVRRHRTWGRLRWPGLVAAFAADICSVVSLPPGSGVSAVDWAFGTVGWIGLILLIDRPLLWLVGFLTVHEAIMVAGVFGAGPVSTVTALSLITGSIGPIGYPLASGIAATALRGVARSAAAAVREAEDIRTADAVAGRLHEHRRRRFDELYASVVPLLRGLAGRTLDPADPAVQRACAIESARMRRLFSEADALPDALMQELRHCAGVADRRGVVVELETSGQWTEPPAPTRRALLAAPLTALAGAGSRARVTVVGALGGLSVGVVADCGAVDLPQVADARVTLTTVVEGEVVWVEAQWTATD